MNWETALPPHRGTRAGATTGCGFTGNDPWPIFSAVAEMSVQQAFALAVQHLNLGRFDDAQAICQQIVAINRGHADSLHMLGILARREGDDAAAIDFIRRALAIDPACSNASFNLGNSLRDQGQVEPAMQAYRRSIELQQNLHESHHNLGCLLRDNGFVQESAQEFAAAQQALIVAGLQKTTGPVSAEEWFNTANGLAMQRRFTDAIAAYQNAIAIRPDFVQAHCNLGNALVEQMQLDASIAVFQKCIELDPMLPQAWFNLGKALYDKGELDEAIRVNRQSIALRPGYAPGYQHLANCLFDTGQIDEAIATLRKTPHNDRGASAKAGSNLIHYLYYHQDDDASSITHEIERWNEQYTKPLAAEIQPHPNDRDPNRRLKIGYVSPDFRHHAVGQNLRPLFARHDHTHFEIYCYSNVARPDSMTHWFMQQADQWHNIANLSDEKLAEKIRQDRIDILVDLALHTQENRLLAFARKPAPVQASFAGYPASTGVTAIDYRISDPYLDPPDADFPFETGQVVRLPHSFWCFDPGEFHDIQVNSLPAAESKQITFGCLSNFSKINPLTLALWAQIMRQVPSSRLILLTWRGEHRQRTRDSLHRHGIDPDRIEFVSFAPRRDYLKLFHRIDISLDTFPFNGHTTSLDSMWMGVPVITWTGRSAMGRAGWCQLSNLGLRELAGNTPEEFVKIAVNRANGLPELGDLRRTLRSRMENSPLMSAGIFTQSIEAAYRQMWQRWCGPT